MRIRNHILNSIVDRCYYAVDGLSSSVPEDADTERCTALSLGCLLRALKREYMWPDRPSPGEINMSVAALQSRLNAIDILTYDGHKCNDTCSLNRRFREQFSITGPNITLGELVKPLSKECEQHFKTFPKSSNECSLLPSKFHPIKRQVFFARHGFLERDFVDTDSDLDSEEDGDYEAPDDVSEPAEEYLDMDQASNYTSDEDCYENESGIGEQMERKPPNGIPTIAISPSVAPQASCMDDKKIT